MKKQSIKLILVLIIGALTLITCNDDSEGTTSDPNEFCNESLCAANEDKKQQCIDVFNECIENEPDANDEECVAAALLICNEV